MQYQPDQPTLSMSNGPDGLIMSEARDATAIDDLEDASLGFYGGVSRTQTLRSSGIRGICCSSLLDKRSCFALPEAPCVKPLSLDSPNN
jgi:hypothetical protein